MQTLKQALQKQPQSPALSKQNFNKKRRRLTTIDVDEELDEKSKTQDINSFKEILYRHLPKEESQLNEIICDNIIQQVQQRMHTKSNYITLLSIVLEKCAFLLTQNHKVSKKLIQKFISIINDKKHFLQKQIKDHQLSQFDLITKKNKNNEQSIKITKPEVIDTEYEPQLIKSNKKRSQNSESNDSNSKQKRSSYDAKLNRLLQVQKPISNQRIKEQSQWKQTQMSLQQLMNPRAEQSSISFSEVLAVSSIHLRGRNSKHQTTFEEHKQKIKKLQGNSDQGFIFYCPKKNKK